MFKNLLIYLFRILAVAGLIAYSFVPMPAVAARWLRTPSIDGEWADISSAVQPLIAAEAMPVPVVEAPQVPSATSITINDPTVIEGDSGTKDMIFNVTAGTGVGQGITVVYTITAVTATSVIDFTATSMTGTLQFTNNNQIRTITVKVIGDLLDENDETLKVNLGSADSISPFDREGIGTIQDNDTANVSIADASITEATATLYFTVTLNVASTQVITVPYTTQNVSATAGQDYTAASGSLVFQPSELSKTIPVTIFDDQIDEGASETFQVNLGAVVNAGKADGQAIGTITDNDTASLNVTPTNLTLREGGPSAPVQINLGSQPLNPVRITIQPDSQMVVDRTVITLTTSTYSTGDTVNALASNDSTPECIQSGQLQITTTSTDPLYNNLSKTIPAAITDNDTKCVNISDLTVTEGDSGSQTVTFVITGTGYINASVNYTIVPVTASTPQDYTATAYSGTLSFSQTDTSKQIQASVKGDRLDENDETFKVVLSGGSNVTIQKSEGIATIIDNDTARVSIADTSVNELDSPAPDPIASFTVTLDITNTLPVTITYNTANVTASAGQDYVAVSNGKFVIPPFTLSKAIAITVLNDNKVEGDETFNLDLSNPVNALISDNQAVGTIIDDDKAALLVNPEVTVVITEGLPITTIFSVWLESQPNNTVTILVQPDAQVTTSVTQLVFSTANYGTPQTVTISAVDDFIAEGLHSGKIRLTTQTNDNAYKNLAKTVTTPIADNDVAGVLLTQYGTILDESLVAVTITYTVRLTSQPTSTVTITPLVNPDYSFNMPNVTFNNANWNTPKIIQISVVDDQIDEDMEILPLAHTVSSQAKFYNSNLAMPTGTVTVNDNDTAGLIINYSGQLITSESGATQSLSIQLKTQPVNTVTIELTSLNTGEGIIFDPYTWLLTFNASNWNQPQQVSIMGVDDFIDDFDQTYKVSVRSVSPDGKYMNQTGMLSLINLDNDGPQISILDASAPENSGAMNFIAQLSAPTDQDVVLHYESRDITARAGLDYSYITGTLTIPKGASSGIIPVGIINDTIGDFDEKFQVMISGPTTADAIIGRTIAYGTITNDGDIGYIYLPNIQKTELKFADLFDTALGWSVVPEAGSSAVVQNGQYIIRHTRPDRNVRTVAPIPAVTLGNVYSIETYAQASPGALPSTRYGLLFDWIDSLRFYRFLINPVTQEYWLYVFNNGWTVLQTGTSPAIATNGLNLLRLERRNANIRAYVNNELVLNTNNATFLGGRVGLTILTPTAAEGMCDSSLPGCTVYAEAAFDYFFVYAISP